MFEIGSSLREARVRQESEALAHGVPLVVAPIKHDQPVTAAQVVHVCIAQPLLEVFPCYLPYTWQQDSEPHDLTLSERA